MKKYASPLTWMVLLAGFITLSGCTPADPAAEWLPKIGQFVNYWNTAEFDGIEGLLAADFALVEAPDFTASTGIENFKKTVLAYHATYPDFRITMKETIIDRDRAAGLWTITATHNGNGNPALAGKHIEVTGISIVHFSDGKILDEWISGNDYAWYSQLGYRMVAPEGGNEE